MLITTGFNVRDKQTGLSDCNTIKSKMASEVPAARKHLLCRQRAVSEGLDVADGPTAVTRNVQPGSTRQLKNYSYKPINGVHLDSTKVSHYSKEMLQNIGVPCAVTQTNSSVSLPLQSLCYNHSNTLEQNVMKSKELLTQYSEKLALYRRLLLKTRNSKTVCYYQHIPSQGTTHVNQAGKKSSRRKDISDGIPVSAGALLASHKREQFASAHQQKDLPDVLPSKPETSGKLPKKGESHTAGNSSGKSGDNPTLDVIVDEGLGNDEPKAHSVSCCSSLSDIQETKVLDCSQDIPTIKLNNEERSFSESGKEKGEGFRQCKKSSGYGTGGSEETVPDEECLSSVFLPSENSMDKNSNNLPVSDTSQPRFKLCKPPNESESFSNSVEGQNRDREKYSSDFVANTKLTSSRTGERTAEIKPSDLPWSANVWKCEENIKIPLHVQKRCKNMDDLKYSEAYHLFNDIMEANSHIQPKVPDLENRWDQEASLSEDIISLQEEENEEENSGFESLERLEKALGLSSHLSWGQHHPNKIQDELAEEGRTSSEDIHLHFSEHSVPSLPSNGQQQQEPVPNVEPRLDDVDVRRPTGNSSGEEAKRTPDQLVENDCAHPPHSANGATHFRQDELGGSMETAALRGMSIHQSVGACHTIPNLMDPSYIKWQSQELLRQKWKQKQLEFAAFCQSRNCEDMDCMMGRRQLLGLHKLFQKDMMKEAGNILKCLYHHSQNCQELACCVPFCDVFHKWPCSSFEKHFVIISAYSVNEWLQRHLVDIMMEHVQTEDFLLLDPSHSVSHESWKNVRVLKGHFLGEFGDFNILHGCISFLKDPPSEIVIKKAISYKDAKNVYFKIGQKFSPYFVQNYWCSVLPEDRLLICSAYYSDLESLDSNHLTPDLHLTLLRNVIIAAEYLHSEALHIVYLNWKCSSVLWNVRSKEIKLCNFSKAVLVQPGCVVICPDNIVKSIDPRFAAPEVLCGNPLGFESDIWGIGCLLHEMLTGSPPYPDHCHASPATIRHMVLCNRINPTYPTDDGSLIAILCRCWELKRADRGTIRQLLEEVEAILLGGAEVER